MKHDEVVFNLFILKFFYPDLNADEYNYNVFVKQNDYLWRIKKECFPVNEVCVHITSFSHKKGFYQRSANIIRSKYANRN